ncbi:MAG: hypothetical protein LQ341_006698 [Variospora aurantia]|nr:MAG: hypothetical protein LQ341_006698 [Variospora aurantia]
MGGYFAEALLKTGKHTVTALQRADGSKGTLPTGILTAAVDYDDPNQESLTAALTGQQILIITLSVRAPPHLQSQIIHAAVKAGVKWIMPNGWGADVFHPTLRAEEPYFEAIALACEEVEALGANYIAMVCGFWYEWSLACGEPWLGFDIKGRKATFFDAGETKIGSSTWVQCARALAALLSLPEEGAEVSLQRWKNGALYVSSFRICQREMLDSLHRVMGTSDQDWTITRQPSGERREEGREEVRKGIETGFPKTLYSRVFFPNGDGDYEVNHGVAKQVLGLPEEDMDEATRRAVEIVESGWTPFGSAPLPKMSQTLTVGEKDTLWSREVNALPSNHMHILDNLISNAVANWERGSRGRYGFVGCNDARQATLSRALDSLYTALVRTVLPDSRASAATTSEAFRVFFGDRVGAAFVARILTEVTTGQAKRAPIGGFSSGSPTFVCIDPTQPEKNFNMIKPDGSTTDAIALCTGGPAASYVNPLPFIILCPKFFLFPEGPISGRVDCPVVNRKANRFRRKWRDPSRVTGASVYGNIQWILLEEIVHYYLYAQSEIIQRHPEVYNINEAWGLSPREQLGNAPNYAYYASILAAVHLNCTDWPRARSAADGRELLEVDIGLKNQPGTVSDDQTDVVINVTSIDFGDGEIVDAAGL